MLGGLDGLLVKITIKSQGIIRLLFMVRMIKCDRGSVWVMDHFVPFCKTMGLEIEG